MAKKNRTRREKRFPIEKTFAIVGAVILLLIIVKSYNRYQINRYCEIEYKKGVQLEKYGEYEKALAIFKNILEPTFETELQKKVEVYIEKVENAIKYKEKIQLAFERLEQKYLSKKYEAKSYLNDLESFKRYYPGCYREPEIDSFISDVTREIEKDNKKVVEISEIDKNTDKVKKDEENVEEKSEEKEKKNEAKKTGGLSFLKKDNNETAKNVNLEKKEPEKPEKKEPEKKTNEQEPEDENLASQLTDELRKTIEKHSQMVNKIAGSILSISYNNLADELEKLGIQIEIIRNTPAFEKSKVEIYNKLFKAKIELAKNAKQKIGTPKVEDVKKIKEELKRRRKEALDFICNEELYTKEKGQAKVNELVNKVREIWETPLKGKLPNVHGSKIKAIDDFLENTLRYTPESNDNYVDFLKAFEDDKFSIKTFSENSEEKKRIAHNQTVFEENSKVENEILAAEKEQIRITNEYRDMMGLYCLIINENLVIGARKHSEYMERTGHFGHIIPEEPFGATPKDRAKKAGYVGELVGENIYMGTKSPKIAHESWFNSAGHHRNILEPRWQDMGVGLYGSHWTQLFGKDFKGKIPQKGKKGKGKRTF